ncbi:1-aminocyclopropane-1-carboxylate deaminase [Colletotrichum orbiculare MAFF 240422]|uniref:1-aminocyclopropane-1-carboxylate deaminase n=1 Tax=Colletotrichum orbiculare (strain 104-T / ATCC 96160 / CBS 514.97 / LARS 414 / MAFF 240422) TaxID=1213857 RepID=N4W0I0_COLOR|nr:1-aminocyclopropane-1-carboxylate deaminase [Colletotrichum orbiculare MAFF 240422]
MVNLPAAFRSIPRVQLLYDRPVDIEPLTRLSKSLDRDNALWIFRDDCNSGLAFGGNKVRKLEYVLADAIEQGADTLVTTGGIQSNHMRQTAAAAARLGLEVALYPVDAVQPTEAEYKYAGNVQLNKILGAETFPVGTSADEAIAILKGRGKKPYAIPTGASTHPLGGLGYARWAFEVLEQESRLGVTFDVVVVALGSGSTLGGMVAGFKLAQKLGIKGAAKRLVGFSILNASVDDAEKLVVDIAKTAAERIGLPAKDVSVDDFEVDASFLGGRYGVLDQRTAEGIRELARFEGIITDPVYTGKAFTGLLHAVRRGGFANQNILFCHTGGQAALSAYPELK